MNSTKLDSYSMLIVSKYFESKEDYVTILCVNSKFKETTEKLRFNPIPITSIRLFPKIQTQYLYDESDTKIEGINKYEIWYNVDYDQYLECNNKNIKCHHISYTKKNRIEYGNSIPNNISKLDDNCYHSCEIKSIEISNHITHMGTNCFCNCKYLSNIILSNGLSYICDNCFSECTTLSLINIPQSIQSLGNGIFDGCINLKTINIPHSITKIGNSCFDYCESLQSITLSTSLILLENASFYYCTSLTNVILSTSLVSIGNLCFSYCKQLKTIELPTSLRYIGNKCFSNCGIESIEIPASIESIGIECFLNCTSLTRLHLQSNEKTFTFKVSYGDSLLYNEFGILCPNNILTQNDVKIKLDEMKKHNMNVNFNFIIPNNVIEIGDRAFVFQTNITSITIPTTVTSIGDYCFDSCISLTTLSIPNSVQSIGKFCFVNCSSLESFEAPSDLIVNSDCFNGCINLHLNISTQPCTIS